MTRRTFLAGFVAAPVVSLKEAYQQLEEQKKRFERDFEGVHAALTWNPSMKDFVLTLSAPVYHSNLSMFPNETYNRSTLSLRLAQAQALAAWIQEVTEG